MLSASLHMPVYAALYREAAHATDEGSDLTKEGDDVIEAVSE